jgi:predicted TPR repeat methyltransferase
LFQRILALEPENKDAMALLADCEAHSGDFQAAVELLTEASRLDPDDHTLQRQLRQMRRVAEGREPFEHVLRPPAPDMGTLLTSC